MSFLRQKTTQNFRPSCFRLQISQASKKCVGRTSAKERKSDLSFPLFFFSSRSFFKPWPVWLWVLTWIQSFDWPNFTKESKKPLYGPLAPPNLNFYTPWSPLCHARLLLRCSLFLALRWQNVTRCCVTQNVSHNFTRKVCFAEPTRSKNVLQSWYWSSVFVTHFCCFPAWHNHFSGGTQDSSEVTLSGSFD